MSKIFEPSNILQSQPKTALISPFIHIGWSVLAFFGPVISLICLLLGRIYSAFLINTLCNLFYDFAAGVPV
ncbi:MAG: hypothetical protein KBS86_01970, partial [Proteobacteria bacterium]|nr:hypothetical protein [Candidatus Enterousia scatequi]